LTHREARRQVIERIKRGEIHPDLNLLLGRATTPPPPDPVFRALLDVSKTGYGELFGKERAGFLRRRYWNALNHCTILTFVCFGLRPNEAAVLMKQDFIFDPLSTAMASHTGIISPTITSSSYASLHTYQHTPQNRTSCP